MRVTKTRTMFDLTLSPTDEAEDATKLIGLCNSVKKYFRVDDKHPAYPLFERLYRMYENAMSLEPYSDDVWTVFYKEGTKHLAGLVRVVSYMNSDKTKVNRLNIEFNDKLHKEIVDKLTATSKPVKSVKKWMEFIKSTIAAYQTGNGDELLMSFSNPYKFICEIKTLRTPLLVLERKVHVVTMLIEAFKKILEENKGDKDDITDYVSLLIDNADISKDAAVKRIEELMNEGGRITSTKLERAVELICGCYTDICNAIKLYSFKKI